jgi:hypothetical protein
MSSSMAGGCQCGAVRYECAAEPLFTGKCHCRGCQKATGGAYVPAWSVKIIGEVKYYGAAVSVRCSLPWPLAARRSIA